VLAGAGGPAGMGIGFKDSDDITLTGNWLVGNTLGTYLDSTPRSPDARVHFERNVLALNDVGVRFHGTERGVLFYDNDLHENAKLAEVEGGGDALAVEFRGNYFSSYEGYDLDRNGMGDVPFEEKLLASALFETHPSLKFLDGSLAMGLIEAASQAVPVLAARTLLRDPLPRMRPERLGAR
jgi:nitrous oxidase accessory protein